VSFWAWELLRINGMNIERLQDKFTIADTPFDAYVCPPRQETPSKIEGVSFFKW
jgi:hypothetical protein